MKSRKLPCEICGKEVSMRQTIKEGESKGKKACPYCKAKNTTKKTYKRSIKPITKKTRQKNKARSEIRKVYFDHHINLCKRSEESGRYISNPTRTNIAHIAPKSIFPSIQADLDNFVYLTWEEHTEFDNLIFSHKFREIPVKFPNSWPKVKSRLLKVLDRCTERNKMYRGFKELIDYAD